MNHELAKIEPTDGEILIKIPKSKINDFIGDVLKTKRRISKSFKCVFNLEKSTVIDIINILHQRINEQHNCGHEEISIEVFFDDGARREYKSLVQFESIDDNLKATSVALAIKMAYLINFGSEDFPSRHEIIIIASSSVDTYISNNTFHEAALSIMVETNKITWAEDIINTFTNYINGQFKNKSKIYGLIRAIYLEKPIALVTSALFYAFTTALFASYLLISLKKSIQSTVDGYTKIQGDNLSSINQKLDYMMNSKAISSFFEPDYDVIFSLSTYFITFSLIFIVAPLVYIKQSNNSYVSIGRTSLNKNRDRLKKMSYVKYSIIFASILSVIVSIISSYIYDIIK